VSSRGPITCLSDKSRSRMSLTLDALPAFPVRLTVTYPGNFLAAGGKVRRDREALKKWLTRRGVGAFWYLEWQRRGTPHLHLLLTERVDKHEVADAWYRIVGSGDERHRQAGTRIELLREPHAAAAYATKQEQKQVPEGYGDIGRLWGHFGVKRQTSRITGTQKETAPLVRIGRTAQNKRRQAAGFPPSEDKGRYSKTLWNAAPAIRLAAQREGRLA
jgi:hypothetical protein